MLHPLPKNVYSLCLVSTLAITTHPPRCCEDRARLVADKLANGKEPIVRGIPAGHLSALFLQQTQQQNQNCQTQTISLSELLISGVFLYVSSCVFCVRCTNNPEPETLNQKPLAIRVFPAYRVVEKLYVSPPALVGKDGCELGSSV